MLRALYTAASGMSAQETNLDNVANNLANSSTTGFRKRRVQFEDMIYQNVVMPGAAATQQTTFAAGLQIGLGTRTAATEVVQLQGDFSATGNPLDLTIQGNGFFQVTLPSGETAYTRSGAFQVDSNGKGGTAPGNPHSHRRRIDHHWFRRHRQCDHGGTDSGAAGRHYTACALPQSRRVKQY